MVLNEFRHPVTRQRNGAIHHNAKLNEWSVCGVMARMFMLDCPGPEQVAKEFGVAAGTVSKVWSLSAWLCSFGFRLRCDCGRHPHEQYLSYVEQNFLRKRLLTSRAEDRCEACGGLKSP